MNNHNEEKQMQRKKIILLISGLVIYLAVIFGVSTCKHANAEPSPEEMISKIEAALGDGYEKQSKTELAATLTYGDTTDKENKLYYHTLKTTFYEGDPAEVTGLHTEALGVLFPVELMDSCEKMKIQDWYAALYKKDDVAYLCWTYSPEVSYVLEYNPNLIDDLEIIKIAESVKPVE